MNEYTRYIEENSKIVESKEKVLKISDDEKWKLTLVLCNKNRRLTVVIQYKNIISNV